MYAILNSLKQEWDTNYLDRWMDVIPKMRGKMIWQEWYLHRVYTTYGNHLFLYYREQVRKKELQSQIRNNLGVTNIFPLNFFFHYRIADQK